MFHLKSQRERIDLLKQAILFCHINGLTPTAAYVYAWMAGYTTELRFARLRDEQPLIRI